MKNKKNLTITPTQERDIQNFARLALSKLGFTAFRNNVGNAWQGVIKRITPTTIQLENARPIRFGLAPGSSDMIGFKAITITPEFLGRKIAVFAAIEIKTRTGRVSEEQEIFLNHVASNGGIAIIARSDDDINRGLEEWMNKKL